MNRIKILKLASCISIVGNLILALLKIGVGFFSGSMAVIADGFDSLSDVLISTITLAASFVIERPPDKEHPYGHFRAETIATASLSFVIFFIGGQLFLSTVELLFNHKLAEVPDKIAVIVTLISIGGKILLAWSQFYFGRKTNSAMLSANGKNMLNDIVTSASVLVGLGATYYFQNPLIDKILAITISVWIMATAIKIFKGLVFELMDGQSCSEPYKIIFQAVREISETLNPHRARIRKLGSMLVIDLDIEVDPEMSVKDAHVIAEKVEANIKSKIENVFDIVVHTEPAGSGSVLEGFGLSAKDVE